MDGAPSTDAATLVLRERRLRTSLVDIRERLPLLLRCVGWSVSFRARMRAVVVRLDSIQWRGSREAGGWPAPFLSRFPRDWEREGWL